MSSIPHKVHVCPQIPGGASRQQTTSSGMSPGSRIVAAHKKCDIQKLAPRLGMERLLRKGRSVVNPRYTATTHWYISLMSVQEVTLSHRYHHASSVLAKSHLERSASGGVTLHSASNIKVAHSQHDVKHGAGVIGREQRRRVDAQSRQQP